MFSCAAMIAPMLVATDRGSTLPGPARQICAEPYRLTRQEILDAMRSHGAYSLTSTTTSMRFAAEALLKIVRRREQESPGSTQFLVPQADWFAAHLETAGVTYGEMSEAARSGFEHHQDALIDYRPQVVEQVLEGPAPLRALDVTIFWPDSAGAPSQFSYKDTLSVPKMDVYDDRVIRFKLLEYADMWVFDRVTGISVRPLGFLSAVFAVVGKPDLKQTRLATSADQWSVVRGQVKVLLGITKTGTATIEPGGRGHEGIPADRADLRALAERMKRSVKVRYGEPSCQTQLRARRHSGGCQQVLVGGGTCAEE
jgi:hypothetical protein